MTWVVPEPGPDAVDGPVTGPDRPILVGYLAFQRRTFARICTGLTADQLALRPVPPSNLSLLGLVRHLTKVERTWFRIRAADIDVAPLFEPELGKDHDFDVVRPDDAEAAFVAWYEEIRLGDAAVAGLSYDQPVPTRDEPWSLRMVYVHLIAEYARHNGHADLLRQSIDGVTGR